MRYVKGLCLAGALLGPAAALAESGQVENAGRWFLNPSTQNWSCSVAPGNQPIGAGTGVGQCKANANDLETLGFIKAVPLPQSTPSGQKLYFYVQEWGALQGPGSECWGDSILIFEVPNTADGARALNVNPIYRGAAQPANSCNGTVPDGPDADTAPDPNPERSHWSFHSVFHDANFGGTYILGQRVRDNGSTEVFNEIWVGESLPTPPLGGDEGLKFTWSRLTYENRTDVDIYGVYAVNTGNLVWKGYLYWQDKGGGGFGATPFVIDWAAWQIRYWKGNNVWSTIPMYGQMVDKPYFQHIGFPTGFHAARGRYELWFHDYTARSGVRPMATCPDDPYLTNMTLPGGGGARWSVGDSASYVVVDINTFASLSPANPRRQLSSTMHPLPSDSGFSVGDIQRVDTPAGWSVYYGSQDYALCNIKYLWGGHWSGSGIRYGRVADVP